MYICLAHTEQARHCYVQLALHGSKCLLRHFFFLSLLLSHQIFSGFYVYGSKKQDRWLASQTYLCILKVVIREWGKDVSIRGKRQTKQFTFKEIV